MTDTLRRPMSMQEALHFIATHPGRIAEFKKTRVIYKFDTFINVVLDSPWHVSLPALAAEWCIVPVESEFDKLKREHSELVAAVWEFLNAPREEHLIVRLNDAEAAAVAKMGLLLPTNNVDAE